MIFSGYHFLQKAQNEVMISKIDDKNSKNDDKKMVKNLPFYKMGGKTRFRNHVINFFKYQYVKELLNILVG
jgi:hypothetical protein